MSLIERSRVEDLAGALFDESLVPASEATRASGQTYFAVTPETAAKSYFVQCETGLGAVDFPGGGSAEGLIDALAEHWTKQGEQRLAAMAPRLKQIAAALREEEDRGDGSVDILCYTMF